jgi:hypothetical protein
VLSLLTRSREQESGDILKQRGIFEERQQKAKEREDLIREQQAEKARAHNKRWQEKQKKMENVQNQKDAIEKVLLVCILPFFESYIALVRVTFSSTYAIVKFCHSNPKFNLCPQLQRNL